MEGLSAVLAKQRFSDGIEFLRGREGQAAAELLNYALSGGLADAACGLMLLKTFAAHKGQLNAIIHELEGSIRRLAEMPTTLEVSGYGYYLLGRCYAVLGIRKENPRSNIFRMALRMRFKNELMDKATSLYLQSIARDSSFVEAVFELGLVYDIGLNARDKAIEAYKMVTELRPDHTLARENLVNLYNETKQYEEAQAEAEELTRLTPNAISFSTLSGIYTRRKMMKEAWLASKAARDLSEAPGMNVAFSSRKHLLAPESVAPVPEPPRAVQPVQPQSTPQTRYAH